MRHLILTLFCLLCTPAMSQEKATKRTCRILFLDRPSSAPSSLQLFDGQTTREVDLPGMNLSPVHEMPVGALKLLLLPVPPADPAKLPEGAPSVEVPAEMVDFYLIVSSDPANTVAPVRMQVVDAAIENAKLGQTIWINRTDLVIIGKLGDQDLLVEPQKTVLMSQPREGAGDYQVTISYKAKDQLTAYPVCETRWVHDPRSRNLGFIISNENSRSPRVMLFPDFR